MHLCMQRGRPGAYSLLLEDRKKSPSRGGEECSWLSQQLPAETWEPVPGPYQCSWGTGTSRTHQPTQARSLASWFGRA